MQVSIPTSALKAAIHCAATKDVRYYLNGVNIEFCHGDVPHINLISTDGHVLSALIRRFHEAKVTNASSVTLWGSGNPRREFIHADDIAEACVVLLQGDTSQLQFPLNLGAGKDFSIKELAESIATVVGYTGELQWDTTKPDGAPRKLLDSSRLLTFGWRPSVELANGLKSTYQWYLDSMHKKGLQ